MKLSIKLGLVVVCTALSVVVVSGCSAPRGLNHKATRPVAQNQDVPQSQNEENFAREVSEMTTGEHRLLSTPLGKGEVSVVGTYQNGLGESCRRLNIRFDQLVESRAAVCLTNEGVWRYVPPLY